MDVITFPENLKTTSDLSILLHGVISLPGATSYDKKNFVKPMHFKHVYTYNVNCVMLYYRDSPWRIHRQFS